MAQTQANKPFIFDAVTATGGRKLGVRNALDEAELSRELSSESLLLLRAWSLPQWASSPSQVPLKDQAALNEQLATLLTRGVPLIEALEVAQSVVSRQTQDRVRRLRDEVSGGASFADACATVGGFDDVAIAVYRASERTGDLEIAADRLAIGARRRLKIREKSISLAIYPSVILTVGFIVVLSLLMFVVPQLNQVFESFDTDLPLLTDVIMGTSVWMSANKLFVVAILVGVLILMLVARRIALRLLGSFVQQIGPIKRVILTTESARFFSIMAAMSNAGVPLADALGVASSAINDEKLRAQIDRLQHGLVEGGSWRTLVDEVTMLPLAIRKLLIAAERSGDLEEALEGISADLASRVDRDTDRMLAILEPVILVVVFALIAPIVISILLPLSQITQGIGR
ncbi:MAG: type II secretion system F family protein [Phycisphaerales bacterium JB043]